LPQVASTPARIPWSWGSKIVDQFRRDRLLETADLFTGTVLDIGCGRKPYAPLLGARARRWIGVDLPLTASGKSRADVYGSAVQLPFATGCVDAVISTEVLEHLPEPDQFFAEASRVLRQGGAFVLTTPQSHGLHEEPHDYFRYTRYGLTRLAEKHGFEVERVAAFGGVIAMIGQTVSHHTPMILPGRAGHLIRGITQAIVQFTFWHADKCLHMIHDGVEESTMGNMLVGRKRPTL
jgi:SAM-dependent methyltransferase